MIFQDLKTITGGEILQVTDSEEPISSLVTDSRKPFISKGALFFSIKGENHDGHKYIDQLLEKGCVNFVVEKDISISGANVIKVHNAIKALQQIAKYHREQFSLPTIGITGSNGKTIVKEWLYSCLSPKFRVVKSPHSFNSQIGVPLSVWNIREEHQLGIFEAGISAREEMKDIAKIIQPTIGLFTNLGSAHDGGFDSRAEKFEEKAILFKNSEIVIYCGDQKGVDFGSKGFSWGKATSNQVLVLSQKKRKTSTRVELKYQDHKIDLIIPFVDYTFIENAMHCVATMLYLGLDTDHIQDAINKIRGIAMRLELKKAINGSYLIDDTYNNDLIGLKQAIEFLSLQNQSERKVVIISDVYQSALEDDILYQEIAQLIQSADVALTIGIGDRISKHFEYFTGESKFYTTTEEFLEHVHTINLSSSVILVKGARLFQFERVTKQLEEKIHGTVLEIDLDSLTHNLNFYRSKLAAETKLMVMVKAFAYGSGSYEIANLLQFHRVDYLGVAYANEGVELRKNGIYLPIMVLNPSAESFDSMLKYDLEPEIYNIKLLKSFITFLNGREANIHLKLETGMKRLGYEEHDLDELIKILRGNTNLKVKSIFSHLAGADEEQHTEFSNEQAQKFQKRSAKIMDELAITPMRHLLNSPGIVRYPEYQFDMVRLGIGLYGVESNDHEQDQLKNISTLKTVVSQIRKVKKGESVGYGRKGLAKKDLEIATIAIGYADGFTRAFSGGVGEVYMKGHRAPVIGNVCMDMTMINVTGLNIKEGDEVEVFGPHISIQELADKVSTIPYEILTNVSQRVKRIYYTE